MKTPDKIYDQRTVRKSIEDGVTKPEEYNKFLKALPDESSIAEEVPYTDEDDELPIEISEDKKSGEPLKEIE